MATDTLLTSLGLALTLVSIIYRGVNGIVDTPYMDEIFHIPQAQKYCRGFFSDYDPKLTTPPGLYLFSWIHINILSWITKINSEVLCTVALLRSINVLFGVGTFIVLYLIFQVRSPGKPLNITKALIIYLFPINFFLNFMYYTDPGSTFFVLISYYFCLKKSYFISATFSLVSLSFRQTNIIWTVFFAVEASTDIIGSKHDQLNRQIKDITVSNCLAWLSEITMIYASNLFKILRHLWSYLSVFTLFAAFIKWNGGIVLGDKSNHIPSFHIPQLYYFVVFTCVLTFPVSELSTILKKPKDKVYRLLRSPWTILALAVAFELIRRSIYKFTIEHPFILADNRHYTFYIWKRFFGFAWYARYLYIPAYMFAFWVLFRTIATHNSALVVFSYFICVMASLIPSPLMEFRYYILPFYFFAILSTSRNGNDKWKPFRMAVLLIFYLVVNLVTFYIFLYHPFEWPDLPGRMQRFMW